MGLRCGWLRRTVLASNPPVGRQVGIERGLQMTTEERLENLERELARAKRSNRWLLAGLGLCLGASLVVWALGRNSQGRYAIGGELGTPCVLDTRTGQLWRRDYDHMYNLCTHDNPKKELKMTPEETP